MLRTGPAAATAATLALALAACGGGGHDFGKEYPPLNAELAKLGRRVGGALAAAGARTNGQIEREFSVFASEAGRLAGRVEDLDPPKGARRSRDQLAAAMRRVRDDLAAVSRAAKGGDARAARTATAALVRDQLAIKPPQVALARAAR